MKNPLIRRLPRELRSELGKYLVLFVFITGMIAIVSGFLVASVSMSFSYNESFEKYNIEDGNFEVANKADETLIKSLEKENVTIFENFYIEKETDKIDSNLRIFKSREEINKVSLMEGELPESENEIAIDRMYADNNGISVGDILSVDEKELKITGLVALSDYSALYSSPRDMMFDAVKFGVAVMTEDGLEIFGENNLHYSYSWKYNNPPINDMKEKEITEDFLENLADKAVVTNFIPQYSNQAIQFTGNDIGRDKTMMTIFLYIVVIIIAFIFALTTSNIILKESSVIGTLRATGYTKGELIIHYITIPVLVTMISALIGNILGYTWFKDFAADMYYASYSLPTYVTIWNIEAFLKTTVIPVILMIAINFIILANKLSLSPLKFIRKDLSKRRKKKTLYLNTKIGIMKRFRLRIISQNMPNYVTIVIGIFMANVILLFGIATQPILDKYQNDITTNMISDYQYILKVPVETKMENVEKYSAVVLKTMEGKLKSEGVTVFGIIPNSEYLSLDFDNDSIYISNAFSEKFGVSEGENITLREEYGNKEYTFKVKGVQYYPAGIAVFMKHEFFNETFGNEADYFNGYFSKEEIHDIEEMYIATRITEDDMTKTSRQFMLSMGNLIDIFFIFGVIMFMLIIYLLSKIIIERNAQSISMTKILGFTNREISGLYIMSTSIVVITSLILTIPIVNLVMKNVFVVMFSEFSGWMTYHVPFSAFVKIVSSGIMAYSVIALLQFKRVRKIPLDVALKNVE